MTSRLLLLLSLLLFPLSAVYAREITEEEARQAAAAFLSRQSPLSSPADEVSVGALSCRVTRRCYLFANGEGRFALMARNDTDPLLLGYGVSPMGEAMPAALRALLSSAPAAYPPPAAGKRDAVQPFLTTIRHQKAPYNNHCPYYKRDDGTTAADRCVVGCVATAMEQIVTYYRRTVTLLDTLRGWETEHYKVEDALPGEQVDTRLIRDDYDTEAYTEAEADAVGRLSFYLGLAARMNWGETSSGANSFRLVEPLKRVFGYKYVRYIDSYKYRPADYWNLLAAEMAARRPVYYAGGITETGGHAFVLDGLDGNGFFHVKWGEAGKYDGFFRLDVLCVNQPEHDRADHYIETGFFCNQEAIVCCPDEVDAQLPDSLERTGREVAVEGVSFPHPPMTGRLTELRVNVRNTTPDPLTTSFALLQNLPADTALISQASWLSMTGCTLQGGESRTLILHTRLTAAGRVTLSLTPDGEQVIWSETIDVEAGGEQQLAVGVPEVSFPDKTTARIQLRLSNASATERAAEKIIYELTEDGQEADESYTHFPYLAPGETLTDNATFRYLTPGKGYTLNIRKRWPVAQSLRFTLPGTDGVTAPPAGGNKEEGEELWYTLAGRRVSSPAQAGAYIVKRGGKGRVEFVR